MDSSLKLEKSDSEIIIKMKFQIKERKVMKVFYREDMDSLESGQGRMTKTIQGLRNFPYS